MALSGSVSTNKYDGKVGLTCTWTATQDEAENKSIISWTLASDGSADFEYYTGNLSLTIDGTTVLAIQSRFLMQGGGKWSRTGTLEIAHNADGSRSFTIEISAGIWYYTSSNCTGSGTFELEQIPRASTATVPNFTMGTGGTIAITRASADLTHRLSVQLGDSTYEIASGVETSYKWTPDVAEWAPRIPDAASRECAMIVDTFMGEEHRGTASYAFTLYVPASVVPSVSGLTVALVNDNAVVDGWGVAVKGYTRLTWNAAASGAHGSTIESYDFTVGALKGTAASGTTGIVTVAGTITPGIKVTDSRGRTASLTADEITVHDYAAPNISDAAAYRCDADGNADDGGANVRITLTAHISPVGGNNSAKLQYRHKTAGGSFTGWTDFTSGAILPGFDIAASYEFELRTVDALGKTKSATIPVPTEHVWFHGRDGGRGAAFGKYAEKDDLLDVDWGLRVRGEVRLDMPCFTTEDGETEWIFPPMEEGEEYRTVERWRGKAVYTKLVNCGTGVAGDTTTTAHGASSTQMIRYHGAMGNTALPHSGIAVDANHISVTLPAGSDIDTVYVQIWYTKD